MTITEFLLARISEDEAVARAANGEHCLSPHLLGFLAGSALSEGDRIVAHPGRVLAECDAKQRIVEECTDHDNPPEVQILADAVLRALALPYADHPDYRDEWRP